MHRPEDGPATLATKPQEALANAKLRLHATERALSDRNSQLLIQGKNFARVLELLATAQRQKPVPTPKARVLDAHAHRSNKPHSASKQPQARPAEDKVGLKSRRSMPRNPHVCPRHRLLV